MPPKSLTPRVPGEALPPTETDADTTTAAGAVDADAAAADQLRAELEAIASLNVPEVLEALATLNRDELILLHAIETDGKGRVTVLGPISDQLDALAADQGETTAGTTDGTADGTAAVSGRLAETLGASDADAAWNDPRGYAAAAAKQRRANGSPVTKAEQPAAVLTAEGWVVPEPEPKE